MRVLFVHLPPLWPNESEDGPMTKAFERIETTKRQSFMAELLLALQDLQAIEAVDEKQQAIVTLEDVVALHGFLPLAR